MVIGGYSNEDGIFYNVGNLNPSLEIIDLIDTTSKPVIVADTNGSRKGAIGGILQNKPVICGGYDSDVEPIANFSIIVCQITTSKWWAVDVAVPALC